MPVPADLVGAAVAETRRAWQIAAIDRSASLCLILSQKLTAMPSW